MFGTKPKHKMFSGLLFCLAAAILVNALLKIKGQGAVTFDAVTALGSILIILSIALLPEFFFLKLSEAVKLSWQSKREKISQKLLFSGLFLGVIAFAVSLLL